MDLRGESHIRVLKPIPRKSDIATGIVPTSTSRNSNHGGVKNLVFLRGRSFVCENPQATSDPIGACVGGFRESGNNFFESIESLDAGTRYCMEALL
eukprot:scaffold776_cov347-Pavlova_lutheri.AAC.46